VGFKWFVPGLLDGSLGGVGSTPTLAGPP